MECLKNWTEVCNIVQEEATKTIPKKKKCKKAKWLPEEALQIAEERREAKGKGERERYTQLNAEFQRIARRDQNAFLNEQCKEMEANNRIGRTRDLFKKIGDMKGTFHAKMGMIKDQNGRDLTEAEEIKKRWQDYTEELYKEDLNIPDNHDGVVTDLEPDILECGVKWALGSLSNNKASGGDSIPAEIQNPKRGCSKSTTLNMLANLENSAVATGLEKVSLHSDPKEEQCQRMPNYRTIALISHASKVMLKILQARLQQYVDRELPEAGLDESPVGIKIAGRNINKLIYADDTTLMAESEEELKSLLMRVKEESAKVGLKINIKKTNVGIRSYNGIRSYHFLPDTVVL
ncbi:hypothetical protein EYD10_16872 [Varanus komodoensis]|nr:hypothetical protein EYD10_16872 [Varanus komodoensis]